MNNEINIEEIMKEIRQNIKDRGYDKEPLSFEDVEISKAAIQSEGVYNAEEFLHEIDYLNHNWCNSYMVPISSSNPAVVFIKKVIRKLTNFIIFPIVNFQNAYNASNVKCMNQMKEYIAEMESYKNKIAQLEEELKQIREQS